MSQPWKNGSGMQVQEYLYDFAADGGAVSTISLSGKAGYSTLPVGALVLAVYAKVVTACTSGGSATLSWGATASATGYSGVAIAVASLTANALFTPWTDATTPSAVLWDNTNDHSVPYLVTSTANTQDFNCSIAVAALTAGKVLFMVQYLFPSL